MNYPGKEPDRGNMSTCLILLDRLTVCVVFNAFSVFSPTRFDNGSLLIVVLCLWCVWNIHFKPWWQLQFACSWECGKHTTTVASGVNVTVGHFTLETDISRWRSFKLKGTCFRWTIGMAYSIWGGPFGRGLWVVNPCESQRRDCNFQQDAALGAIMCY